MSIFRNSPAVNLPVDVVACPATKRAQLFSLHRAALFLCHLFGRISNELRVVTLFEREERRMPAFWGGDCSDEWDHRLWQEGRNTKEFAAHGIAALSYDLAHCGGGGGGGGVIQVIKCNR
jgi:hypothetical protein